MQIEAEDGDLNWVDGYEGPEEKTRPVPQHGIVSSKKSLGRVEDAGGSESRGSRWSMLPSPCLRLFGPALQVQHRPSIADQGRLRHLYLVSPSNV